MAYDQPIIIKKVKKHGHGHHGGAWKIAYADFVTAMMAFFMLLWLISMTTPEQKKGIADYFAPPNISQSTSGSGGVLGGTALDTDNVKMAGATPLIKQDVPAPPGTTNEGAQAMLSGGVGTQAGNQNANVGAAQAELQSHFDQNFHAAAASIRQAWQAMPDITKIADNLIVQETKDGLDIQLIDQEGRRMFPEGSKYPYELTRKAIAVVAPILQKLPNQVRISGHTAAGGIYNDPHYGSWELSSDRANVVREILGEFGLSSDHVNSVAGRSVMEPFFPNDPYLAANERVEITVLYDAPPVPPNMKP
ncbi:MAG TPA: flagellar motor protein MotB [Devosiaceae bacterium]|jgi:chemotaxis protein MotB